MDDFRVLLELGHVRPDDSRQHRTGVPEVVLAEGKSPLQVVAAVESLLEQAPCAVITRMSAEIYEAVRGRFGDFLQTTPGRRSGIVRVKASSDGPSGVIGIITAGSSDIEFAEEARLVAEACGVRVHTAYDVGVAGIHRLKEPLEKMLGEGRCRALIVAAGMDGALPSVVCGLVDVPVIGLPTSVGYGFGGAGVGALMSMLQSCAPGLSVVNIDNGVGAAAAAVKIARQAEPRPDHQSSS